MNSGLEDPQELVQIFQREQFRYNFCGFYRAIPGDKGRHVLFSYFDYTSFLHRLRLKRHHILISRLW